MGGSAVGARSMEAAVSVIAAGSAVGAKSVEVPASVRIQLSIKQLRTQHPASGYRVTNFRSGAKSHTNPRKECNGSAMTIQTPSTTCAANRKSYQTWTSIHGELDLAPNVRLPEAMRQPPNKRGL